jgi:hypothetical protein
MKKHVELEPNTLIKKFCKKQSDVVATISLSCELAKKWEYSLIKHKIFYHMDKGLM